jgi:hypothetical protein
MLLSLFSVTGAIASTKNSTQNTYKMIAIHTFQPWQPPSSHGRLGTPHLAPRHTTISQDHLLLFLSRKGMVGFVWGATAVVSGHHGGELHKTV